MNEHWFIDLRAWSHGGPVGTVKVLNITSQKMPSGWDSIDSYVLKDVSELVRSIKGQDVLLMTHGFENNRPDGIAKLVEWKSHLTIKLMPFYIGILWPGDCIIPVSLDYIWEGSEAEKSGVLLGRFVNEYFGGAASISFGSHSLGVRVMLQAILQLGEGKRVRHLFTMAAAIENDTLHSDREFGNAAEKVDHISVIYSSQDYVLKAAYPAGNLVGGLIQRGDPNLKAALGFSGPLPPLEENVISDAPLPDAWKYGHTDYLSVRPVIGDFDQPIKIPRIFPSTSAAHPAETSNPATLATSNDWKPCWSANFATTRWLEYS